jgi:hypothetical protein
LGNRLISGHVVMANRAFMRATRGMTAPAGPRSGEMRSSASPEATAIQPDRSAKSSSIVLCMAFLDARCVSHTAGTVLRSRR